MKKRILAMIMSVALVSQVGQIDVSAQSMTTGDEALTEINSEAVTEGESADGNDTDKNGAGVGESSGNSGDADAAGTGDNADDSSDTRSEDVDKEQSQKEDSEQSSDMSSEKDSEKSSSSDADSSSDKTEENGDTEGAEESEKAGDPAEVVTITGCESFDKELSYPVGTLEKDIDFPKTLKALVGEDQVEVEVTWELADSDAVYDCDKAGDYVFRAVLPDGYKLDDEVKLPEITVTLTDEEKSLTPSESGLDLYQLKEGAVSADVDAELISYELIGNYTDVAEMELTPDAYYVIRMESDYELASDYDFAGTNVTVDINGHKLLVSDSVSFDSSLTVVDMDPEALSEIIIYDAVTLTVEDGAFVQDVDRVLGTSARLVNGGRITGAVDVQVGDYRGYIRNTEGQAVSGRLETVKFIQGPVHTGLEEYDGIQDIEGRNEGSNWNTESSDEDAEGSNAYIDGSLDDVDHDVETDGLNSDKVGSQKNETKGGVVPGQMWISQEASFAYLSIPEDMNHEDNWIHKTRDAVVAINGNEEDIAGSFSFSIYEEVNGGESVSAYGTSDETNVIDSEDGVMDSETGVVESDTREVATESAVAVFELRDVALAEDVELFSTDMEAFPTDRVVLRPETELAAVQEADLVRAGILDSDMSDLDAQSTGDDDLDEEQESEDLTLLHPVNLFVVSEGGSERTFINGYDTIAAAFSAIEALKHKSDSYVITYRADENTPRDNAGNSLIYINGKSKGNITSPVNAANVTLEQEPAKAGAEEPDAKTLVVINNAITLKSGLALKNVSLSASAGIKIALGSFTLTMTDCSIEGAGIASVTGNGVAKSSCLAIDNVRLDDQRLSASAVYRMDKESGESIYFNNDRETLFLIDGNISNVGKLHLTDTVLEVHGTVGIGDVTVEGNSALFGKANVSVKSRTTTLSKVTSTLNIAGHIYGAGGSDAVLPLGLVYSYTQNRQTVYAVLDLAGVLEEAGSYGIYTMPAALAAKGIDIAVSKNASSDHFKVSLLNFPESASLRTEAGPVLTGTRSERTGSDTAAWSIGYVADGKYYQKGYIAGSNDKLRFTASTVDGAVKLTYEESGVEESVWVAGFADAVKEIERLRTKRDYTITYFGSEDMPGHILSVEPTSLRMPAARYVNNLTISGGNGEIQNIYFKDKSISLTAARTTFENINLIQVSSARDQSGKTVYADANYNPANGSIRCPGIVTIALGKTGTLDIEGSVTINTPVSINGSGKGSALIFGMGAGFLTAVNADSIASGASGIAVPDEIRIYGSVKSVGTLDIRQEQSLFMYKYATAPNKYTASTLSVYNLNNAGIINVLTGRYSAESVEDALITNVAKTYNNTVTVTETLTNTGIIYVRGNMSAANLVLNAPVSHRGIFNMSAVPENALIGGMGINSDESESPQEKSEIYATGTFKISKSLSSSTDAAYLYSARKQGAAASASPALNVGGTVNVSGDNRVNVGVVQVTPYKVDRKGNVISSFSEGLTDLVNMPLASSMVLSSTKGTIDQFRIIDECLMPAENQAFAVITEVGYETYKKGAGIYVHLVNTAPLYVSTSVDDALVLTPVITPVPADGQESTDYVKTWSIADKRIATVKAGGTGVTITGKKKGQTTLYATLKSTGEKIACTVVVSDIGLKMSTDKARLSEGETVQLSAVMEPAASFADTHYTVSWSSGDDKVAAVDDVGLVTAVSTGVTGIVAEAVCGGRTYTAECQLIVMPSGAITVTAYGAVAGDSRDDRQAFQNAANAAADLARSTGEKATMFVPAGTYNINGSVFLQSNTMVFMDMDAIVCETGKGNIYGCIGVTNVEIAGGQLRGNRSKYPGAESDGVHVLDSSYIKIHDVNITDMSQDGIYLGCNGTAAGAQGSTNITLKDCVVTNSYRDNVSITNGSDITITGCTLKTANGADPKTCLEVEVNSNNHTCKNITVTDCLIDNRGVNGGYAVLTAWPYQHGPNELHAHVDGMTFDNCQIYGEFANCSGKNVEINNSVLEGAFLDGDRRMMDGKYWADFLVKTTGTELRLPAGMTGIFVSGAESSGRVSIQAFKAKTPRVYAKYSNGTSIVFSPKQLKYQSSNTDVATLSSGVIRGVAKGSAKLTYSYSDAAQAMSRTINVTVTGSSMNILFIGNSITIHGKLDGVWWGNYGMAASSREKDYVHKTVTGLQSYATVNYNVANLGVWETATPGNRYPQLSNLDGFLGTPRDVIVIQLGENCGTDYDSFIYDFYQLLAYIKLRQPNARILVLGEFWQDNNGQSGAQIDGLKAYDVKHLNDTYGDLTFISLSDLWSPEYQSALGNRVLGDDGRLHAITNADVARHAGDAGMAAIADKIVNVLIQ